MTVVQDRRKRWQLPLAVLIAVIVRFPFWTEAWRTPLDADTAIIGLMARHPVSGLTMWGQPYGSPLEAWLALPILALGRWTPHAMRLFYFLMSLGLVPLAHALGRRLHPAAAFPAALLMACPPAYFVLLSAMPPPLYPATLLLCGMMLILSIDLGQRSSSGAGYRVRLALWGTLAGLALWTHLTSLSVVIVTSAYIAMRARRPRAHLILALVPLLLLSSPVWIHARAADSPGHLVRLADAQRDTFDHLGRLLPKIHRPLGGVLGTHAPIVADNGKHVVSAPRFIVVILVATYVFAVLGAFVAARRSPPARMLLVVVLVAVVAFALPLRSRVNTIRYLTPLYLPLAALVAWAPAALSSSRRAVILALSLAALHLAGARPLVIAWHRADRAAEPFLRPDFTLVKSILAQQEIERAYASYGPAYRLTFESGEKLIVSQPSNERFARVPLPYHDEVRFAKNTAWILTPSIPSDMPAPEELESWLRATGGAWRRIDAGDAIVYCDFMPPRSARVATIREADRIGDGDPTTAVEINERSARLIRLPKSTLATGLVLVSAVRGSSLPAELEVSVRNAEEDFMLVHEHRARAKELWWANGHPELVADQDLCSFDFVPRLLLEIRITVAAGESGTIGEVLLKPPTTERDAIGWKEWLPPSLVWRERFFGLQAAPHPEREDWQYRMAIAQRSR